VVTKAVKSGEAVGANREVRSLEIEACCQTLSLISEKGQYLARISHQLPAAG
jgi:hypothetical protein